MWRTEYEYLNNSSDEIDLTDYYATTTATSGTPGGAAGYEQDTKIVQGQEGTPILQTSMDYYAITGGSSTIYPTADSTQYRNTDGTGAETTSYSYTFFSGTVQMQSMTTSLPVVDAAQNGADTAATSTDVYDANGNVIWSMDANGFITYNQYDPTTQALIKTIQDVNTDDTSDFDPSTLPSGWTTPSGGGLELITTYQVDQLGRTTEEVSPNGNVTYTVYNDAESDDGFVDEVRTYPGWHYDSTLGEYTTTGPVQVSRYNDPGSYSETLTYAYTPVSGVTAPTGTDTISNIQTLSRSITNDAGQTVESDAYFNLSGLTYSASTVHLGTSGTNYYATEYGYDANGNQCKVVDPNGTITRTVYDALNRPVSTWVGTDDTPESGYWSPSNPAGMTMVSQNIYDDGGVGDGNLTETIAYPGGDQPNRVTLNDYDWRDRLVASKSGVVLNEDGSEDLSAEVSGSAPISYTVYDNLNEAIESDSFDGADVAVTSTDGVPNAPSSSLLKAKTLTYYDDQGRVFETQQFSVDPTTGDVSDTALTTEIFYDLDGNIIAAVDPTGEATKMTYDGADRNTHTYITDDGQLNNAANVGTWAAANSVTGDIVLTQTNDILDGDGNVIEVISKDRLPTDSDGATGALADTIDSPPARTSFSARYFDDADRDVADENVGVTGDLDWTRPSSPDASDATHLVTTTSYNSMGLPEDVVDPKGIDTRTLYDALGRATETIVDYTDGIPTDSSNQTTAYTYDGNGNIITQTAVMPSGTNNQVTEYVYGVTTGTGSAIDSNDLLAKVEYPDPSTGDASDSASNNVEYTYDALGEQLTETDQNGTTHTYAYDTLGREISDTAAVASGNPQNIDTSVVKLAYSFNSAGLPFQQTSYDSSNDVVNQVEDVYNGLGQLSGQYQAVSGSVDTSSTPEVQYAYSDPSTGSLTISMTYPNGRVINYGYDGDSLDQAIGRVDYLIDSGSSSDDVSYTYLGEGTIIGQAFGNGITETTTLDQFGRTAEIMYVNSSDVATDDFQYGYDQDGNVLYKLNLVDSSLSELYIYDNLNRLTSYEQGTLNGTDTAISGTPGETQTFDYDALGNQLSVTTNGTEVDNTVNSQNELTANGGASLTYDNNGNTLTDSSGNNYTYNGWNQEMVVTTSGDSSLASYTYDANGNRISQTEGGSTTNFYLSNQGQTIEERQGSTVTAQNLWGIAYVNNLIQRTEGSTVYYIQEDANFNTTAVTDTSGSVQERYTYLPYGSVTVRNADGTVKGDGGIDASTVSEPFLFQGGRLDAATGENHFGARDENPGTGTWGKQDTDGYINGLDLYRFEFSTPEVGIDPSGNFTVDGPGDGYFWFLDGDGETAFLGNDLLNFLQNGPSFAGYLHTEEAIAFGKAAQAAKNSPNGLEMAVNDKNWTLTSTDALYWGTTFEVLGHTVEYSFVSTADVSSWSQSPNKNAPCFVTVTLHWSIPVRKYYTFQGKKYYIFGRGGTDYWLYGQLSGSDTRQISLK